MVYGYATTESIDSQGEIVSKEAIKKAWDDYMKFGNVREMHQPSAVGVTKEYQHDDTGTWIGVFVVDDRAWKFVKEGVYKAFSIGGRVLEKSDNKITELVLSEISLVDRPANPDAIFEVVKMDGSAVDAMINIKKEETLMNLAAIFGKNAAEWTEEEKTFVKQNAADLSDEQKEVAKDVLSDEPAPVTEEPAVDPAPEAPVPEAPVEEAPVTEVPAEDAGKADVPVVMKDASGVITLAYLLESCEYMIQRFASDGKNTKSLDKAKAAVMAAIQEEAAEKGATASDLAKVSEDSLRKVLEEAGVMKLGETIADINKRLAAVENAPASPRPSGTGVIVEKDGVNAAPRTVSKLQGELGEIQKEIDAFALKAKDAGPDQRSALKQESEDLFGKMQAKKKEIEVAMVEGRY